MSVWMEIVVVHLQKEKNEKSKWEKGAPQVLLTPGSACYWCQLTGSWRKDPRVQAWSATACKTSPTSC